MNLVYFLQFESLDVYWLPASELYSKQDSYVCVLVSITNINDIQ